jgi:hypothetical protein
MRAPPGEPDEPDRGDSESVEQGGEELRQGRRPIRRERKPFRASVTGRIGSDHTQAIAVAQNRCDLVRVQAATAEAIPVDDCCLALAPFPHIDLRAESLNEAATHITRIVGAHLGPVSVDA